MRKRIIRLTENDLHKIIKNSVKRIIKESHGEPDDCKKLIYDGIIDDNEAEEIAEEYGVSKEEGAAMWFKGVVEGDYDFLINPMPRYREFVMDIPSIGAELYHDYGAGYYFLVKNDWGGTCDESVIRECDGACGGGGATNAAGAMQGGGASPDSGQYTVPFGSVQRRKGYNDFMKDAMDRKGGKNKSISMNRKK